MASVITHSLADIYSVTILIRCVRSKIMRIIAEEKVPLQMKIAKVTPILKPGKPKERFQSYRPVSVLPNFSSILDRILTDTMNVHVKESNTIHSCQYGFSEGKNTMSQLVDLLGYVNFTEGQGDHCC